MILDDPDGPELLSVVSGVPSTPHEEEQLAFFKKYLHEYQS